MFIPCLFCCLREQFSLELYYVWRCHQQESRLKMVLGSSQNNYDVFLKKKEEEKINKEKIGDI